MPKYPHQDKAWFEEHWVAAGYNLTVMAENAGLSIGTVNRWFRRHQLEWPDWVNPKGNTRDAPHRPPLVPILADPITMEGDLLVLNDVHAPLVHYPTFDRALLNASKVGLTQAVIVGDLTNQDAIAGHELLQKGAELDIESDHLNYVMDSLLDVVEVVVVAFGNHDRHAMVKLKVDFERSLNMLLTGLPKDKLDRIHVTWRDHVIVHTERGPWRLCHTRAYRKVPLAYPNELALKFGMHVAGAHRHHMAIGRAANGKDIVDLPAQADFERMAYLHRYTNSLPDPQNGYSMLIGGRMQIPMLTG